MPWRRFLQVAWKHVLTNHAHDSICGCSIDQVHRDMMYRFDQARVMTEQVRSQASGVLTAGGADLAGGKDEFTLTIVADIGNDEHRLLPNMQVSGRLDQASMVHQYQQCHALITPSRYEGFGYTALEAMPCGRPVIATNNTALPEVVGDTGLLCDVDSVDQFVDATRHLRNNPDEARRLGIAARERAVEHFSEEKMIEQYVSLYRSVSC